MMQKVIRIVKMITGSKRKKCYHKKRLADRTRGSSLAFFRSKSKVPLVSPFLQAKKKKKVTATTERRRNQMQRSSDERTRGKMGAAAGRTIRVSEISGLLWFCFRFNIL